MVASQCVDDGGKDRHGVAVGRKSFKMVAEVFVQQLLLAEQVAEVLAL